MVTSIQAGGTLQELSVPAKSTDVLEWLRTKLKQPGLQFQGKIQDKDKESWVTVFAESGSEDDDDAVNQHVLGGNFQDEVFVGCIVVMLSKNEAEAEAEAVPTRQRKPRQAVIHDVNTPCPLRDLVKQRYVEIGIPTDISGELEAALLQRCIRDCAKQGIEVTWANVAFWHHYRGRCIQFYENAPAWIPKLVSGELTPTSFADMTVVELDPKRWKAQIEAQIEKDKHLYSSSGSASIYFYCSACKKKTKCDYYQMQTRSADEPMTTFVTCLECDRRWKF